MERILLTKHPAYTDSSGNVQPTFYDAVGVYCWAWFILTVIYTIAAIRSSWVLFMTLLFLDVELLLLATGYMLGSYKILVAGNSVGFVVAFCSCQFSSPDSPISYLASGLTVTSLKDWAGCAALWSDVTPLKITTFPMSNGQ